MMMIIFNISILSNVFFYIQYLTVPVDFINFIKGNLAALRLLLDYNAVPDVRDLNGYTPLDHVVRRLAGQPEHQREYTVLDLLLEATACSYDQIFVGYLTAGDSLLDTLVARCGGARPLKQLCRSAIRRSLTKQNNLACITPSLPIPFAMQRYLLLQM